MIVPEISSPNSEHLTTTDAVDAAEWDSLVSATDNASFCHLSGWRSIIEDVFRHEAVVRGVRNGSGALCGVLPLIRIRSRVFGDHLVSVPFLNYGGPAGTAEARSLLCEWAIDEAKRLGVNSLLLRNRYEIPGDFPVTSPKVAVVLTLPATADHLWNKTFNAKFRGKIKRPQRDGMVTSFGVEHLDAFYEVFAQNMRDLGTPVPSRQFFERIISTFPHLVVLGVTYWNERPVASGFGFVWRNEFEMTWSASARELRAQKPNMLLYWDYMKLLIERGVQRFNFGRSTPGSGTHEFKQSWGGVDESLPWLQWPPSEDGSRSGVVAQLASTCWRYLPVRVANSLGPALARQLPWW